MCVPQRVNELAGLEPRHMGHHQRQQRVGRDVERHAQEDIRGALIELTREFSLGDIKLEQAMTWRQRHMWNVGDIPRGNDQPARVRGGLDVGNDLRDLVDNPAFAGRPGAPLGAIDGPQIAALVGPLVPDRNAVRIEIRDVGIPGQKPQQLVHDRLEVQLLGRHERKAGGEIEAHLPAEHTQRPGPGPIAFGGPVMAHMVEKSEILLHSGPFL